MQRTMLPWSSLLAAGAQPSSAAIARAALVRLGAAQQATSTLQAPIATPSTGAAGASSGSHDLAAVFAWKPGCCPEHILAAVSVRGFTHGRPISPVIMSLIDVDMLCRYRHPPDGREQQRCPKPSGAVPPRPARRRQPVRLQVSWCTNLAVVQKSKHRAGWAIITCNALRPVLELLHSEHVLSAVLTQERRAGPVQHHRLLYALHGAGARRGRIRRPSCR